jgi:predicted PurR-regulated permease PerM
MNMKNNNQPVYINISSLAIIKVIAIILLAVFLYVIRDILALVFVALIFASAVDPWVDWMQSKKIPRVLGILFIYMGLFTATGGVIYLLMPPIIEQLGDLSTRFPLILDRTISTFSSLKEFLTDHGILNEIKNYFSSLSPENIQSAAANVITKVYDFILGIFAFFLVLVMTFYIVVEENALKKIVWSVSPEKYQIYIINLVNRMQKKIGLWLRGQLILSCIIFLLTYISLSILGVKYALVLALVAGMTEFVPYLGPLMASIPAIFLAYTQAPMLALFVAILYYIIQLVENNIIVPKLMQKVVGLNPIISIVVLLIGYKIAGIPGAILAIPVATAAKVFINDVVDGKITQEKIIE